MSTVRTINLFANLRLDIGTTPPTGASIAPKMIQKFQRYFHDLQVEIDTPRRERTEILGSTKPLNLDSLKSLDQRWGSPQATLGMPYPSWITPSSFLVETKMLQNSESSSPYKSFAYC